MVNIFRKKHSGFTLAEMMVAVGCGSLILGAAVTAGVALQRSFAAAETNSIGQGTQLRVLDYLAMDARRATDVSVAADLSSVTFKLPDYYQNCCGSAAAPSNPQVEASPSPNPNASPVSYFVYYDGSNSAGGNHLNAVHYFITYSTSGNSLGRAVASAAHSFVFRGNWVATTDYAVNDVVSLNNQTQTYVCTAAISGSSTNQSPPSDTSHWSQSTSSQISVTTTTIATNVASFRIMQPSQQQGNSRFTASVTFNPVFGTHSAHTPQWTWGAAVPTNSDGSVDGDYYVDQSPVYDPNDATAISYYKNDVYLKSKGAYTPDANTVYCNVFLRNPGAR
jgi:type II secretory pathway component PulJ